MTQWDAPNQQVVRDDASPPWEEGTGGATGEPVAKAEGLEGMTKDELLAYAKERDISPANASMNKADLIASIEQADQEEEG